MKKQYSNEVAYVNILIVLLIIVMLIIGYISSQKKIYAIETEIKTTQTELEHSLQKGINSVLYLSTVAQELTKIEDKLDINISKNVHLVNEKGEYALDREGFLNITGHGGLNTSKEVLHDMEMSLALYEHFKIANKLNKEYEWVYYISKYKFLTMYPYIPSSKYIWHYENSFKDVWQYSLKKNNPNRNLFFTPLYVDGAGKGLMVTMGKPVYKEETFRGTLNIDVTVKTLSQFLDRHNLSDGVYVLVNRKNQIIASSGLSGFNTNEIFTLENVTSPLNKENNVSSFKYYIDAVTLQSAPWKLYYYKDRFSIFSQSLIYIFFILLIIGLLFKLKQLMSDLEKSNKKLTELSSLDPMTSLYNKRYFSNISHKIFNESKKNKSEFGIIILDIDTFKKYNDKYGHLVGDKIIIHLSLVLKNMLRKDDIICRYGGEEFIILLPDIMYDDVVIIAEKIRHKVEVEKVFIENDVLAYTVSLGVSKFEYKNDKTIQDSIGRADKALYKAKENGKNKVETFFI